MGDSQHLTAAVAAAAAAAAATALHLVRNLHLAVSDAVPRLPVADVAPPEVGTASQRRTKVAQTIS